MADIQLYTTRFCGYCVAAKRYLTGVKGVPFTEIDVSSDYEKRAWLRQVTGRTTVPQIFIGDTPIGGYTELRDLDRRGELDPMLAGA